MIGAASIAQGDDLATQRMRLQVKPNILFNDQVGTAFVIPVIGSNPGVNGTFFKSDVTISNFRSAPQRVRLTLIPRANSGITSFSKTVDLPAYEDHGDLGLVNEDFMLTQFGLSGLAAALVEAIDSNGNVDTNARIDGVSRIWTPLQASFGSNAGTASAPLLSVKPDHLVGSQFSAFTTGMRQDANFRTNVGIVNLSNQTLNFRVDVFGTASDGSFNVSVPAFSFDQFAVPAGTFGTMTVAFTMLNNDTTSRWTAWTASVDNRSGDSWSRNANY